MRNLLCVGCVGVVSAITLSSVLLLVGCDVASDHGAVTSRTTSAAAVITKGASTPGLSPSLPGVPPASGEIDLSSRGQDAGLASGEWVWREETPQPSTESRDSPYTRPPLEEPRGSRFSDVGVPYPLPSPPVEHEPPPTASPTPSPAPAPFVETSFGPPFITEGFFESSFGPDAEP